MSLVTPVEVTRCKIELWIFCAAGHMARVGFKAAFAASGLQLQLQGIADAKMLLELLAITKKINIKIKAFAM